MLKNIKSQLTFNCSKWTIKTREHCVKSTQNNEDAEQVNAGQDGASVSVKTDPSENDSTNNFEILFYPSLKKIALNNNEGFWFTGTRVSKMSYENKMEKL